MPVIAASTEGCQPFSALIVAVDKIGHSLHMHDCSESAHSVADVHRADTIEFGCKEHKRGRSGTLLTEPSQAEIGWCVTPLTEVVETEIGDVHCFFVYGLSERGTSY